MTDTQYLEMRGEQIELKNRVQTVSDDVGEIKDKLKDLASTIKDKDGIFAEQAAIKERLNSLERRVDRGGAILVGLSVAVAGALVTFILGMIK